MSVMPEKIQTPESNETHLATEHLLANLKGRTLSSGVVTLISQGALFALNLGSAIVLARMLNPQDFGLIVMVTTIFSFFRIFKEIGLSTATVQREGITHAQVSNLFWINSGLSGLITLCVALSAPAIAWFYREPRLVAITVILSTNFLLSGLSVQHLALLNRQMRFKAIGIIQVTSTIVGVIVGISMARLNFGYWSVVGMNLTTPFIALGLTWWASAWRPQLPKAGIGTRPLLNFGIHLAAGEFVWSLARGTDAVLIGRIFGAGAVGLYSRASVLLVRPLELFTGSIGSVFMPTLSRLQNQENRYRSTFLQLYEAVGLVGAAFTSLLLVLAHPLTLVVLGPKWENASSIFAAFTVGSYCFLLTTIATWLFASQGRGKESMNAVAIASGLSVITYLFGLPFGPLGVAIAYSAAGILFHVPLLFYMAGRRGPVHTKDLFAGFFRHLPVWGMVFAGSYLAYTYCKGATPLIQLEICAPIGLFCGLLLIGIYPPSRNVALNMALMVRELSGMTMKRAGH